MSGARRAIVMWGAARARVSAWLVACSGIDRSPVTGVYVAIGVGAMALFVLAGVGLFASVLRPEAFVTLSTIAAALLLGSIAKLEVSSNGTGSRGGPTA